MNFELDIPVIVFSIQKLEQVINDNPFINNQIDTKHLYVTFLYSSCNTIDLNSLESKKLNSEEMYSSENTVYLYCLNGYGKTKLSNTFLENKLNVVATTRNWKTTNEILKIAQQTALKLE